MYKMLKRHKKGMTLIEVIIAVGVMAIVFGGIMQGLNITLLGTHRDSQINSALHLAQAQMEYIKSLPYDDEPPYEYGVVPDVPDGYDIDIDVEPAYEDGIQGMQSITITVSCEGKNTVVYGYKTNRLYGVTGDD
jgi:prepilin-type N-terminal cleavage/methylation domain-containing protein